MVNRGKKGLATERINANVSIIDANENGESFTSKANCGVTCDVGTCLGSSIIPRLPSEIPAAKYRRKSIQRPSNPDEILDF